jgi:hypothetical protein
VLVEVLPEASEHSTSIVYTRPSPLPERSARKSTVESPVTSQSGEVLPAPLPLTGSSLPTEMILHEGLGSELSETTTATATERILWLGGHSTLESADTLEITGGVTSPLVTAMSSWNTSLPLPACPGGGIEQPTTPRAVTRIVPGPGVNPVGSVSVIVVVTLAGLIGKEIVPRD